MIGIELDSVDVLRIQIAHEQDLAVLKSGVADRLDSFFGGVDYVADRLVAGELVELELATVEHALREVLCDLEGVGRVGVAKHEVVNVLKMKISSKSFQHCATVATHIE